MLLCDTSGLLAFFDRSDRHHGPVVEAVDGDTGPFVVSPYVVAELDYLLARHRGVPAELAALGELCGGAWKLASFDQADLTSAIGIVERYADQSIDLADASLVVLAHRYRTDRLLTLDRRHFGVVRTIAGRPFTLLPSG